eukprot:scaffold25739_cov113-Cylindrotheca_fusiformis.AAC.2
MCLGSPNSPTSPERSTPPRSRIVKQKSCLKVPDMCCSTSSDSSASSGSSSIIQHERSVSFHSVEINEFPMILGDNPDCSGIPVQIGWQPHRVEKLSLDTYEEQKPQPRKRPDLVLTPEKREAIVAGTPQKEIRTAVHEANQIRRYRQYSVDCMSQDEWDYKMERFERKVKKVLSLKFLKSPKSKKDQKLIRAASVPALR